jgi:hypothetical protein
VIRRASLLQKAQTQIFGDRLEPFFRAYPAETLSQTLPL